MQLETFESLFANIMLGRTDPQQLQTMFSGYSEEEITARLSIYKNNIFAALIEVLGDRYPAVFNIVGEEFFKGCCVKYISQNPPRCAAMVEFATDFPKFLQSFQNTRTLSYLADVARIELARHRAYHAADIAPVDLSAFNAIDLETLSNSRFAMHPSMSIIASDYACYTIWNQNRPGISNEFDHINADNAEWVLVARPFSDVETLSISDGIYLFLQCLIANQTLSDAIATALDRSKDFNPTGAVQFLIQAHLVTNINGELSE